MNRILLVEDDTALRRALTQTLCINGYEVVDVGDAEQALAALGRETFHVAVTDVQLPAMNGYDLLKQLKKQHPVMPVIMMTAYGSIAQAVAAMRHGANDYLVKPFELGVLLAKLKQVLPATEVDEQGMVAVDAQSLHTLSLARRVAGSDASVLIHGESGTGKEVLAKYIHAHSRRARGPFVAINCAAIPENMLEATLFGYEKGAFTGAYQSRPGKFEQAQEGTLLLDEISEMDLGLQAKLLRVIQEREVERLGGKNTIHLNVRILATTNRALKAYVDAGKFREDLYYRLNVFPILMAPLRQRRQDIMPLARALLARRAAQQRRETPVISPQAETRLCGYVWPGNVRELDNLMQRALILQPESVIDVEHIHFETQAGAAAASPEPEPLPAAGRLSTGWADIKQRENSLILSTLKECRGSRKLTAEKLGLSPRTLRYKLARMKEQGVIIPEVSRAPQPVPEGGKPGE